MTYWQFHLVFIFPALAALLGWRHWRHRPAPPRPWLGIAVVAAIALVYTTPWDNYLILCGVWSYQPDRVASAWRVGYVPFEEYLFFVLQPVLTGLCLLAFYPARAGRPALRVMKGRTWLVRLTGAAVSTAFCTLGVLALKAGGQWLYAGLILAWGAPPLALHWLYGGETLWRQRQVAVPAFVVATGYLWVIDRVAIGAGIWSISTLHSTGWTLLGLPAEEALFFAVTNGLIIQALLLFWQWKSRTQAAGRPHP